MFIPTVDYHCGMVCFMQIHPDIKIVFSFYCIHLSCSRIHFESKSTGNLRSQPSEKYLRARAQQPILQLQSKLQSVNLVCDVNSDWNGLQVLSALLKNIKDNMTEYDRPAGFFSVKARFLSLLFMLVAQVTGRNFVGICGWISFCLSGIVLSER